MLLLSNARIKCQLPLFSGDIGSILKRGFCDEAPLKGFLRLPLYALTRTAILLLVMMEICPLNALHTSPLLFHNIFDAQNCTYQMPAFGQRNVSLFWY